MELSFENKTIAAYEECVRQNKRCQVTLESVVPDTHEDIGRIATVQTELFLKSKELTGHTVSVEGELRATLLYIAEGESSVSFLNLSKPFQLEFEADGIEDERLCQVRLRVLNSEARALNPRKVSLAVEVEGELRGFCRKEFPVAVDESEQLNNDLHLKRDTAKTVVLNAVCEKTFALNEQFSFPEDLPEPDTLICEKARLFAAEVQQVGSRLILKGTAELDVCYMPEGEQIPICTKFQSPFSQIIETEGESCDESRTVIELSSAYYELSDTISGDKALDVELHAVLQLVSFHEQTVEYVSDAYSNQMPVMCCVENRPIVQSSEFLTAELKSDEKLDIAEDCGQLLCNFVTLNPASVSQDRSAAAAQVELIYRKKDGGLACARRSVKLQGNAVETETEIVQARIREQEIFAEGEGLSCRICAALLLISRKREQLSAVVSVKMDEEANYDTSAFPTVMMVRVEQESLWDLAKSYHSSVEEICAVNEMDGELRGQLLMIPKER